MVSFKSAREWTYTSSNRFKFIRYRRWAITTALLRGARANQRQSYVSSDCPIGPVSCARAHANRVARALERRPGRGFRVGRIEAAGELRVQLVQGTLVAPARDRAPRVERVPPRAEERLGAAVTREAREALVEGRLALHVQRVVGQLVDDRGHELHRVALHNGRQERIREVPER